MMEGKDGQPLAGRTAVVTGGAQSIGLAIARRLAGAGATVIVADRQPPPDGFLYQRTDIGDEGAVAELMAVAGRRGGLHILVNNAGVGLEAPLAETNFADWRRLMATNVDGVFLCVKHALAPMCAVGGGNIVNIGSIEGNGANPLHAAYAASKGGGARADAQYCVGVWRV